MSDKPNNPPLFDHEMHLDDAGEVSGYRLNTEVTLRDLLAAAALMSLDQRSLTEVAKNHDVPETSVAARTAYLAADAMLREREVAR